MRIVLRGATTIEGETTELVIAAVMTAGLAVATPGPAETTEGRDMILAVQAAKTVLARSETVASGSARARALVTAQTEDVMMTTLVDREMQLQVLSGGVWAGEGG
jgi:hypothetical protein